MGEGRNKDWRREQNKTERMEANSHNLSTKKNQKNETGYVYKCFFNEMTFFSIKFLIRWKFGRGNKTYPRIFSQFALQKGPKFWTSEIIGVDQWIVSIFFLYSSGSLSLLFACIPVLLTINFPTHVTSFKENW